MAMDGQSSMSGPADDEDYTPFKKRIHGHHERKKKSAVWNYFGISKDDSSKAVCVLCNATITRGGSIPSKYTTTNMRKHLEKIHADDTKEVHTTNSPKNTTPLQETAASTDVDVPKLPITPVLGKTRYYSPHHFRHKLLTRKVLDMIVLDCQPFEMIDDQGFRNLVSIFDPRYQVPSSSHFTTTELSAAYAEKQCQVRQFLLETTAQPKSVACTCDVWTKETAESFQSLTAHVLDQDFKRHSVILDTFVAERESGDYTAHSVKTAIQFWNIPFSKVITFLRDDSPNVVKAFNLERWPAIGCMGRSLHLAIQDSLSQSDYVEECLAKCRGIVEYIKHTPSACQFLTEQNELNISEDEFVPEIDARINSPLEVVSRLVKQRDALILSLADSQPEYSVLEKEWTTVDQLTELLEPIHELARNLEASDASLGMVIPGLTLLEDRLEVKQDEEQEDVKAVRISLKKELKDRSQALNTQNLYLTSTVLDPRFKTEGFPRNYTGAIARKMVESKLQQLPVAVDESSEPPEKTRKIGKNSLWAMMSSNTNSSIPRESELDIYLSLPRCSIDTNIFTWWNQHQSQFPNLAMLAREVFCVPPTTSDCERLFGLSGNMKNPTRCSSDPEIINKIAFLKKNVDLPASRRPTLAAVENPVTTVTDGVKQENVSDYVK